MANTFCPWCKTGIIEGGWKDADGSHGWTCSKCGDCEDHSVPIARAAHAQKPIAAEARPAKRSTVRDMVRSELGTLQAAGVLSKSLILEFNSKGVRIYYAGEPGFIFASCVGVMVWLDRVRAKGHITTPTAWECYLRKVAAPKLYVEATTR